MSAKREVEVFTAGCTFCDDAVKLVKDIACPSCDVTVQDTRNPEIAKRAKELGVKCLPAVVIDGKLAGCCCGGGIDEASLRAEGIGTPL